MTSLSSHAQVLYIPHGGGPLPLLGDPAHQQLVTFLQTIAGRLRPPKAILVISAHWEERQPTILGAAQPPLLYDYYGFSDESYQITYPAPGAPELAEAIRILLTEAGLHPHMEMHRGFDHGLFVPLKLMYPSAAVPCLQLSLLTGLDPHAHIALGQALAPLLQEQILVIGSGLSFHNMEAFFTAVPGRRDARAEAFNAWLIETCTNPALSSEEREKRLIHWQQAPHARYCHPREEHLMPLHVCFGMTRAPAKVVFDDLVIGKPACALLWEQD